MNFNFPSMQPKILEELEFIYDELTSIKTKNKELQTENENLKILIKSQNKKIDLIHKLFNTYSKIVSENTRKIEKVSDQNIEKVDLIQQIKNLENELFITKLSKNDIDPSDMRNILTNLMNQ